MKFNYKFRRLCGSYYGYPKSNGSQWSGSNVVYDDSGDQLIAAALNRIQVIDLKTVTVRTLPWEGRSNICVIALHQPFLLTVDVQNYAILSHLHRGIILHRFKLKDRVRCVQFSPSGTYLAIGVGKHVEIWLTPKTQSFCPLQLHRTYTGLTDDITCLLWSPDESVIAAASRDCSVRVWTVHTTRNYIPATLQAHKTTVLGLYIGSMDKKFQNRILTLYTVSVDGSVVTWECKYEDNLTIVDGDDNTDSAMEIDEAVNFFTGGDIPQQNQEAHDTTDQDKSTAHHLVGVKWRAGDRHYLQQDHGSLVTSTSYCPKALLLVVGFSSGIFGLYEMPNLANIHTLSVGANQLVHTCSLNATGDWLALACPSSQQLLVWEWRSETYVLKQRGHAYGMKCLAYSPDSICIATGGEDGKLKLWNSVTGFCYVTLSPHTAPVTGVAFGTASVVVTSSLDGTVQAHDLHRYRTFRTFTSPTPVQFLCLAVDSAGEIVVAGSTDPFHIYAWNMQTGRILDVLSGHAGPVCSLSFQTGTGMLASASWDGTVKTWDLYKGSKAPVESLSHTTDVVCVAYRPDGAQVCSANVGGLLSFWDTDGGKLLFEIDGRRDITGGRKMNDRRTANNNAASRYFTSVCYSADGSCVIAGGNSKYVCIYDVARQILLKKFQISHNRSLDGVLDELNSKNLGDGGPIDEEADSDDEADGNVVKLPGAKRGDDGSRRSRVEVLTMQVSFSPTGREWAIISGEGLHVYSLDDDMIFDPIALTEEITPAAVHARLASSDYGQALSMALHLNEFSLLHEVLDQTPFKSIGAVVRTIRPEQLERLTQAIAKIAADTPHIEFYLEWCLSILQSHGTYMDRNRGSFMRAFRAMHKAITTKHDELKAICNENRYTLEFVQDHASLLLESSATTMQ